MSRTETPTLAPAPAAVPAPPAAPRTSFDVQADLTAARATFREMEAKNRDYYAGRNRALARREKLKADWQKANPDDPFSDSPYYEIANAVPPEDGPDARAFHKHHYTIAALEKELEDAKRREVGV